MIIGEQAYRAMVSHMIKAQPEEGCGLLAGAITPACPRDIDGDGNCGRRHCPHCGGDGRVCDVWVSLLNVSEFPRTRFEMDDRELIAAWEGLDLGARRPWIVCHSHVTDGTAPSENDIRYATDPTLLHAVVSLQAATPVVGLWRIDPDRQGAERVRRVLYEVVDLGFKENPPTDLTRRVSGD